MDKTSILAKTIEDDLIERFGTLLGSSALAKTLGHSSVTALAAINSSKYRTSNSFQTTKETGIFCFC